MSSLAFTIDDRKELTNYVVRLMGRAETAIRCPLTGVEQAQMWNGLFDCKILEHARALEALGYDAIIRRITTWKATVKIVNLAEPIVINLSKCDGEEVDVQFLRVAESNYRTNRDVSREELRKVYPHGAERFEELIDWGVNYARLYGEVQTALRTFMEIAGLAGNRHDREFGFCKTVGQLNRILPELVQYVPEKADLLRNAKRASTMPAEWINYDRRKVIALQETLAKCHLLPRTSTNRRFGDAIGPSAAFIDAVVDPET